MNNYRKDFPLIKKSKMAYLDNAATTQKPQVVIKRLDDFYCHHNANPHRGVYPLGEDATKQYEDARNKVAEFVGAKQSKEIVFTKNATEAINLVANSYGQLALRQGDKIVLSIAEHHSNLVPWQLAAQKAGATIDYIYVDKHTYTIPEQELNKIDEHTKIVAVTLVSNVLGVLNDIADIIKKAHSVGAVVLVDGAQAISHTQIDVQKLDADFFVFSGHKIYAPLGIGVLYGKQELLEKMPPFMAGGNMIEYVSEQNTTFAQIPARFEAGTPNLEGAVGLSYAIDYINSIGYSKIQKTEKELFDYALSRLKQLPYIELYVPNDTSKCSSIISFNIKGLHSHDVASMLASHNVCVRSGYHCAQPLLSYLGINSAARASFALYNTKNDVDKLIDAIEKTQ